MGVRLRTTLVATTVVAVALCAAAAGLLLALHSSMTNSTRKLALQDAEQQAAQRLTERQTARQPPRVVLSKDCRPDGMGMPEVPSALVPADGDYYVVTQCFALAPQHMPGTGSQRADGAVPYGLGSLVMGAASPVPSASPARSPSAPSAAPSAGSTGDAAALVQGRASLAPVRAATGTLTDVLVPGIPALLGVVALVTWFSAGRALRPVTAIRMKVADITARDLHERVPETAARDEVAALARTVNCTLDRLETAVRAHRQFVADAAHELRSPMAVLRTRLELARPEERRLATAALTDVERLQALTADLLLLARLDAREPIRTREVDLAQIVAEEAAGSRPRHDVRVILDVAPDLLVDGSSDHLRRLVANLVDNAVRHAGRAVTVVLARDEEDGQVRLDVTDDGPGIPPEHRGTVFERFTRLDLARNRDTGGAGLGLPIARDIALAHGGTLQIVDGPPGATLRVVLPVRDQPDD